MRRPSTGVTAVAVTAVTAVVIASSCGPDGPDATAATRATAAPSESVVTTATAAGSTDPSANHSTAGTVAPNGVTVEVRALDNTFRPETVEIEAGTEVLWINGGRNEHNVLPVGGDDSWGVDLADFQPGDEYAHVFDVSGTYRYYCSIHATEDAGMIGVVEVVAPS